METSRFIFILIIVEIITLHCYILPTPNDFANNNILNWFDAESYCLSKYNSHLLSLDDPDTGFNIANEIINMNQHDHNFWIDLSSNAKWTDGTESKLIPKTNLTNSNTQYITLKAHDKNANTNILFQLEPTNGNSTNFWICNDSPTQSTLSQNPFLSLSIFIIIGVLFAVFCVILISTILILKLCKHRSTKKQNKQSNNLKRANVNKNKKAHYNCRVKSKSNIKPPAMDDYRASVDQGIIDKYNKLQCISERRQKSKSSMNVTIDMSTGHIVMNIEEDQPIEFEPSNTYMEHKTKNTYRKRNHKNLSVDEIKKSDPKSLSKPQKSVSFAVRLENKNDDDDEHIVLEPDEFIVEGNSVDETKGICNDPVLPDYNRKITDFNDYENDSSHHFNDDARSLQYIDEDGYYMDDHDEKKMETNEDHDGIRSDIVSESKEGYSKKRSRKQHRIQTNDSDEEYYEEPDFNRENTDAVIV